METAVMEPTEPLLDPLVASVSTEVLPGSGTHELPEPVALRPKKEIQARLCEMDNDDIKCGLGACKPDCLQGMARKETYLVLYCLIGIVMGMFFTYSVAVISTIEKRFNLNSKQTGIMLAGNDVSQVMLSMLIAYYGNYGNRPRWMGFGVVCAAVSSFIAVAPHLIYGSGVDADAISAALESALAGNTSMLTALNDEKFCPNTEVESCNIPKQDDSGQSYNGPVIILFISQFFVGVSISSYYSIGIIYLDDNISKKETPLYYGISMIVRVLGPVMGFFLGSRCLSLWIDPRQDPDINMRDPRWLGAWWLGYVILGVLLAIVGFLLFFFPRQLPSSLAAQLERLERATIERGLKKQLSIEHYLEMALSKKKHTKPSMKKLPEALKRLCTNKIWLGNSFNTILVLLAYSGYWSFKPKYLENQFHQSASSANFYTGLASLVASVFGIMLGSIVMRWKRPNARIVTGYNLFITVVSAGVMLLLVFVGCPKVEIQGFGESCSDSCQCSDKFLPVCSETGETFYSACYAGCTGVSGNSSEVLFTNCSCIASTSTMAFTSLSSSSSPPPTHFGTASKGYCEQSCNSLVVYIVLNIVSKMISASGRVGGTLVYLRSVHEEDKALALGTLTVLISLFAFIPGPIIMGSIVDSSCLIWDTECNQRGNCWLYDSDRFRIVMHLFTGALMFLSILGDIIVFIYSKGLKLYDEPEEDLEMHDTSPPEGEKAPKALQKD